MKTNDGVLLKSKMRRFDLKEKVCCFTGHRPEKLTRGEDAVRKLLEGAVDSAIERGFNTFITGMAEGTDIWAAEIVLSKKQENPNINLVCALPHPDFEKSRSAEEKQKFKSIIDNADLVKMVNERYFTGCYQVRNKWMVDLSGLVIAVWNGTKSGTANTVKYAVSKDVAVVNVLVE